MSEDEGKGGAGTAIGQGSTSIKEAAEEEWQPPRQKGRGQIKLRGPTRCAIMHLDLPRLQVTLQTSTPWLCSVGA